jgi:flavin-dependent dehydrogenase
MAQSQQRNLLVFETDAVVIGAGLAGIAAAIHLARSGFRVICIEQQKEITHTVGESLDWSAPELLANLGLPMDELVSAGAATWKKHITVTRNDSDTREYLPGPWLAESPWNVEVRTLHLNRDRTDARLREIAQQLGISTLNERVVDFAVLDEDDPRKRRILGLRTAQGTFVRGSWFIDASGGHASLLGKRFGLKSTAYGPRKAAIWAHLTTKDWVEGTTLYMPSPAGEYMEWIWEIPIRPGVSSVGYVAPGASVKAKRAAGLDAQQIYVRQCREFAHLRQVIDSSDGPKVSTTSFLCRTYQGVCGANWIIIGEAASQSDPITGNGVTAALRHAEESVTLVHKYRKRGAIPHFARSLYNRRAVAAGRYFNSLIEKIFYQPILRDRLGLFGSARLYTVPAWLMNLIYARLRPRRSMLRTMAITWLMDFVRLMVSAAFRAASLLSSHLSRQPSRQPTRSAEQSYAL